jgi:hypothetical protein
MVSYGHEIGLKLPPGTTHEDINLHRFCRWKSTAEAIPASTCVASVEAAGQKHLVSQCFDQFINFKVEPRTRKYIHEVSGNSGVWHRTYAKTDNKLPYHRYDYTELRREFAGVTLGRRFADILLKPGSKASNELNQSEMDLAFAQGYKIGYLQPDLAGIKPDTYCKKGKPTCQTADGSVKNEYPHSDPPTVKAPDYAIREDGKLIKIWKDPKDQDPIEACITKAVVQMLRTGQPQAEKIGK